MLKKELPYAEFWMRLAPETALLEFPLPTGFILSFYQSPSDQQDWAAIETSVLEFADVAVAEDYFAKTFAPYPAELANNMLFIKNKAGEKIATATAWWKKLPDNRIVPLFHWLAVKPEYSGQGLAKVLISQVLMILRKNYPSEEIYLHTQTWSAPAVKLYQKFGFEIMKKNLIGVENPDYQKVLKILNLE